MLLLSVNSPVPVHVLGRSSIVDEAGYFGLLGLERYAASLARVVVYTERMLDDSSVLALHMLRGVIFA